MTQNRQGLAGGSQTLRDQETAQNLRRGIAEATQEGRTIVMTTPWGLWGEIQNALRAGRNVMGWDIDRPNRIAYLFLGPQVYIPMPHLRRRTELRGLAIWSRLRRRNLQARKGGAQ